MWQSIKCLSRFTHKPQGTSLSIENSADIPFPAITVCGGSGYGYNLNELKKCSKRYQPSRQFRPHLGRFSFLATYFCNFLAIQALMTA